ncbi:MAG: endonuclease III [Sphaerochaetaceae bacterium]|nr:endonuclease III [Sphaerochaetaceae bacterium]MDC7238391.1 endonuclease III [Sphaerochaetaceae bacterium]MDC7243733.1 endonuclease III [Sphaerochaetaceae bacterium]MDC7248515.1 endonuclease III [Sphaerochaetaceae bacterium]
MNEKEYILKIYEILDKNSREKIVFLDKSDPFQFLISVILSAQTTDKMVNIVTIDLFDKYPDAKSLSNANYLEVCQIIKPTGFYKVKAKNIINCAKALVDKTVPDNIDELVKLPGVGRKTANCVIGDIYHKGAVIVDTHVKRVLNRLEVVKEKDPTKIEMIVRSLLEDKYLYRFSMTVNLHGRQVCHARKPNCSVCVLKELCPSRDA